MQHDSCIRNQIRSFPVVRLVMSLSYIGRQLTIYIGSILLLAGIVGNGMNIFIFSSVHTYRTTPSTFYFLVSSICNGLYILSNLIPRIINASSGIDLTRKSIIWCKTQQFLISFLSLTSFTCSCLATIDQFLVTSRNAYLRSYSKIQWAHRIVLVTIIIWCLHGIPCFFFYNISSISKICDINNAIYAAYIPIFVLVLLCVIPVLVMVVFGCLTYRNIRQTKVLAEQNADRQLTKMILIQVALVVVSMTPMGIYLVYNLITARIRKDMNRLMKEYFIITILVLVSYIYYVVCLFVVLYNSFFS